jgi:curved DNA-binding protein CbpA
MNYYDELGLAPDAADEAIRRAHRTLSRVLHPDRQTDPAAREAAELQMRRINAMADTLLDPRLRRRYDESLHAAPLIQPDGLRRLRFPGPARVLLLTASAALVLTGTAAWFFWGDLFRFERSGMRARENGVPEAARQATSAVREYAIAAFPAGQASAGDVRRPRPARQSPPQQITTHVASVSREDSPAVTQVRSPPVAAPSIAAPPVAEAAVVVAPPEPTLTGLWLYVPDTRAGPGKLYAPEYIQLLIRDEDGILRGEYAARYRVPDRAISANVTFRFEGNADQVRSFEWEAEDGSRGVVDLKPVTAESLQVNWRVNRFGPRLGLGAGTATLIRKIDP